MARLSMPGWLWLMVCLHRTQFKFKSDNTNKGRDFKTVGSTDNVIGLQRMRSNRKFVTHVGNCGNMEFIITEECMHTTCMLSLILVHGFIHGRKSMGGHVPLLFEVEGTPCVFCPPYFLGVDIVCYLKNSLF